MRWLSMSLLLVVAVVTMVGAKPERQERTPPTRCIPPSPCFPSRQMIAELAANISGSVYQPSDVEYAALVTSTNGRLTRHPAIVVVVATERDVQMAVLFARKFHLMLTVASINGDFTRGSYEDAALQINLGKLQSVSTNVDLADSVPDPGTVTAQAGVTWPQLMAAASAVNRDVVGQGFWNVPIGEQTQAGGFGPISRSLGLAADSLLSARMVTMGGSVVEVSDAGATLTTVDGVSRFTTVDPGLWQALRGGGAASYGIVVSYTFRMHLPPSYVTQVSASYLLYENDQFVGRDPLKFILPLVNNLPSQWGGMVFLNGLTSDTTVGQKGRLVLDLVHYGAYNSASYNEINALLNYNGNGTRTSVSVVNRTNVLDFTNNIAYSPSNPARFYAFETLLPAKVFTDTDTLDDFVDTLLLLLNDPAVNAHYECVLQPLGGVISTINSTARVTEALRTAAMSAVCWLSWEDADGLRDDMFVSYGIHYSQKVKAFGIGTTLSYGFYENEDDWKHSLYGDNYKELMRVKTKYDVDNFLWCHNCVASDFRLDCRRGCERYGEKMRRQRLEKMSEENENRILKFLMHDEY